MSECMENAKRSAVPNGTGSSCAGNSMSREALLSQIDEVSFAAYDTMLYLDTHQEDETAMEYYREMIRRRREALSEYGRQYGPLTAECASATADGCWQWAHQPWPWEGGRC